MAVLEIDQSGKWEDHSDTVIGVSIENGMALSALVSHKAKNQVMSLLGTFYQEKNRSKKKKIIRMFTYSVFLAVRDVLRDGDVVLVDKEYEGNEDVIRQHLFFLIQRFTNLNFNAKQIQFGNVGKNSLAHAVAHQTFTRIRRPEKVLSKQDFFMLLDRSAELREKALRKRMRTRN